MAKSTAGNIVIWGGVLLVLALFGPKLISDFAAYFGKSYRQPWDEKPEAPSNARAPKAPADLSGEDPGDLMGYLPSSLSSQTMSTLYGAEYDPANPETLLGLPRGTKSIETIDYGGGLTADYYGPTEGMVFHLPTN